MKRIVVTGAGGNCGGCIQQYLLERGYDVLGVDVVAAPAGRPHVMRVDLSDFGQTIAAIEGADGVVHFGAIASDEQKTPAETFRNNLMATFNVLESCRVLGVNRVAVASSIEVHATYALFQYVPLDETHPPSPRAAYGTAKLLAEHLCDLYHDRCGMSIASFRLPRIMYSHTYPQRLPRFWEKPELTADCLWTYVDGTDIAEACLLVMENDLRAHEVFWLVADDTHQPTPTMQLLARYRPDIKDVRADLPGNACPISHAKITRMLGWQPKVKWADHYRPET